MFTLNCNGRLLLIDQPVIMGIINVTPDSFYKQSRLTSEKEILHTAEKMLNEGAEILDIGGQSTRPGSSRISADEELKRIIPAIQSIMHQFTDAFISIDTYYSSVAKEAVAAGACIVNDISAGKMDNEMVSTVAGLNVPYIIMHMKGTPENMQDQAVYNDLSKEVLDYFIERISVCKNSGIKDVIIDPGFGFAKTIAHNLHLLKHLATFKMLDKPILAGLSRKSTVYKTLGISAEEAINGTTVLNSMALINGANILRVHDVKEAKEAIKLLHAYQQA
ncbi:dihydropteroate synthase [soil metagenome]